MVEQMLVEFVCQSILSFKEKDRCSVLAFRHAKYLLLWSYIDTADISSYVCQSYECHLPTDVCRFVLTSDAQFGGLFSF